MRIGIFGGAFNPPHIAHLRAAFTAFDVLELDTVYFVPLWQTVHKKQPQISADHRVAMLELALAGKSWAKVDMSEINRGGKSYTIDTAAYFKKTFADAQLNLIIGEDALYQFDQWLWWRYILKKVNLLVLKRNHELDRAKLNQELANKITVDRQEMIDSAAGKIYRLGSCRLDISSSMIRNMISQEQSPKYLLPDNVLNYIQQHKLYDENVQDS